MPTLAQNPRREKENSAFGVGRLAPRQRAARPPSLPSDVNLNSAGRHNGLRLAESTLARAAANPRAQIAFRTASDRELRRFGFRPGIPELAMPHHAFDGRFEKVADMRCT